MLDIVIQNEQTLTAPDDQKLIHWANKVLQHEGVSTAEICIRIVPKDESRSLNNTYRGKNKPTNVLSFPSDIPEEFGLGLMGDLAICSDIVIAEAQEHHIDTEARWAHMITHGVLHLLGYDHLEESEAIIMETLETKLLSNWGYNHPYQPIDINA